MRFMSGLVVGLVLGLAASAGAYDFHFFLKGSELQDSSRVRQTSYVAGVFDTLEQVLLIGDDNEDPAGFLSHAYECLDKRSDNLGDLTDWAQRQYGFHKEDEPAAQYILMHACDKP
jgi:hypothetical protein